MQRPSPQHLKRKNSRHTTRRKRGKGAGGIPIGTRGCCRHLYIKRSHPLKRFEASSIPSKSAGSSEFGTAGYDIAWTFPRWTVLESVERLSMADRRDSSNDASKSSPKVGQIPFRGKLRRLATCFGLSPPNSSSSSCSAPNSAAATPAPADGNCTATVSNP